MALTGHGGMAMTMIRCLELKEEACAKSIGKERWEDKLQFKFVCEDPADRAFSHSNPSFG